VSRDPVEEEGGQHLYGFCTDNAIDAIDAAGKKISKMWINASGNNSEIEEVASWRGSLTEPWNEVGAGGKLGFVGGIGKWIGIFWDTKAPVGLFKFEAVASWCIPKDRRLATWKFTRSLVQILYWDKWRRSVDPISHENPILEGPTSALHVSVLDPLGRELPTGTTTKIYAWDAPRLALTKSQTAGFLKGDWLIRVEDNENAWEGKIHLDFYFEASDPASGTWNYSVLIPPHEVQAR
jgi:hypothetical protein